MSGKKQKFLMVTPSESRYLDIIRSFVARIAGIAGFDEEHVNKIQLSVDEACTNVVKHAYKGIRPGEIRVELEYDQEKLEVSVIDRGKGFDLRKTKLKNMDNYLNEFRKGGLGIQLMQILMDRVTYSVQPMKKNRVTMVKYLDRVETREQKQRQKLIM